MDHDLFAAAAPAPTAPLQAHPGMSRETARIAARTHAVLADQLRREADAAFQAGSNRAAGLYARARQHDADCDRCCAIAVRREGDQR